jgi:hypothetical protein
VTDYSYGQLETLWENAGGSKALAPLMAAIALAESGGNSAAENPSGASGLWQILGAVNAGDQGQLFNPQVNAHEAVLKYTTQGLGAWTTYTSGAYEQYYQGSTPAAALPQGGGGAAATSAASSTTAAGLLTQTTGVLSAAGTLVHDAAIALNDVLEWFKPGQGFRLGAALVAVAAGYATFRLWAV